MNAPETIKPATQPINLAHEVLLKADEALCVEEVARAILGGDKPTKACIKDAAKQLKKLADLGLIEMEPRARGVPFYRLIVAPNPQVCEGASQTSSSAELVLTPEAQADRDDFEREVEERGCTCLISPPCGFCTHPGNPRNQEEDETAWMAAGDSEGGETDAPLNFEDARRLVACWNACEGISTENLEDNSSVKVLAERYNKALRQRDELLEALIHCSTDEGPEQEWLDRARAAIVKAAGEQATSPELQYLAPEDYEMPPADPKLLAMANRALHDQAQEFRGQLSSIAATVAEYLPDPSNISTARAVEILDMLADAQSKYIRMLELDAKGAHGVADSLQRQINKLRTRAIEQASQRRADIANLRTAHNHALNEADRLRAELASEKQAREALQEQANDVDVKDAAVGYLIRVPKRDPILRRNPDSARLAALAAVRAGAARADVLAVVPVGVARRGAEWGDA